MGKCGHKYELETTHEGILFQAKGAGEGWVVALGSLKSRQTLHIRVHLILKSCRKDEWEQKERMVILRVGFQATGRKPTTD